MGKKNKNKNQDFEGDDEEQGETKKNTYKSLNQ